MPKRSKAIHDDSESDSDRYVEKSSPSRPLKKKTKSEVAKKAQKKKKKEVSEEESSEELEEAPGRGNIANNVLTNDEGDKYVKLGPKRRLTVRSFKGKALIDIREFYGDPGDEKPGKKGISLSAEQWEELKSNISAVDGLLQKLN